MYANGIIKSFCWSIASDLEAKCKTPLCILLSVRFTSICINCYQRRGGFEVKEKNIIKVYKDFIDINSNFTLSSAVHPCLFCDENASCEHETCVCKMGFLGDGLKCTSKYFITSH